MIEAQLVEIINNYFKLNRVVYANEVRMAVGIPDVMVGYNLPHKLKKVTDYYALKLYLAIINEQIASLEEMYEKNKMPKSHILKYVRYLVDNEIISVNNEKIRITQKIDLQKLGITVAIEAKVKDWRGGLSQAERYLNFADYSYVALSEKAIHLADQSMFLEKGIGLISVAEGSIQEVVQPVKSCECNSLFKYISVSSMLDKFQDVLENCTNTSNLFSIMKEAF